MNTAWTDGHRLLYHWQLFRPERLQDTLANHRVYCSSPNAFNDPWDCKPHFNSDVLKDPDEAKRHADWAVAICARHTPMSSAELATMHKTLLNDQGRATELLANMSTEIGHAINERYRVYCLCPDVHNTLLWAHYADSHRGICLEFGTDNDVFCGALRCQYSAAFPLMKLHDDSDDAALRILLAKSDAWRYEAEYRLVAQERAVAVAGAETLMTDKNFLAFPAAALRSVIVGCQADHAAIQTLVNDVAPGLPVRRAIRVPNRYELAIT